MSIKQSISLLALFWGVSFSASAKYMQVTGEGNYGNVAFRCTGLSLGSVIDSSSPPNVSGISWEENGRVTKCLSSRISGGFLYVDFNYLSKDKTGYLILSDFGDCPEGTEYNPATHQCEEPPEEPFCSKESTQQEIAAFEAKCAADGGNSSVVCNDLVDPPDFRMSCDIPPPPPEGCEPGSPSWPQCLDDENKCDENHPDWNPEYGMCCNAENDYCDVPPPESCTIFSPNWPECAGDTDIDPPSGGDLGKPDKPDGGGSGNPEPDKPEPDVDDKPDANQAIKAMNEDMNKQLTSINNDMNKNHAESKSALDALKASIDLNTDTSVDAANHLQDTLERQGQADAAMGNKTNQLLTSANNLLNGGFASLSNGLDDLQGSNEVGFGNVVGAVEGLGEKIDGIGDISDPSGTGPVLLYDGEDLLALRADVDNLKDEYKSILNDFKNYFNFNSGVNSGDFNSHNLGLNWQGHEINKENQVLKTLRDNAGIISAVVIFMFGVAGIRVLVGAL